MDAATKVWFECQLLSTLTGWPPDVVNRLSRAERRGALIFRQRWQEYLNKQRA